MKIAFSQTLLKGVPTHTLNFRLAFVAMFVPEVHVELLNLLLKKWIFTLGVKYAFSVVKQYNNT